MSRHPASPEIRWAAPCSVDATPGHVRTNCWLRPGSCSEQFHLTQHADTYAGELSGGQRRLVEIMRALMAEPKILLLDEPMAGVNPTLRLTVEEHLSAPR